MPGDVGGVASRGAPLSRFGDREMKKASTFLALAVAIAAILGCLFAVIVCAPEPWQTRPWTVWERGAGWLLAVLGWPITLGGVLLDRVGGRNIPEALVTPFFVSLFILSGAFWAGAILLLKNRFRRGKTPNQASEATSEPAPGAASSSPQGSTFAQGKRTGEYDERIQPDHQK